MLAPHLQPAGRTHISLRGRKLAYFGGCDYFRLSHHPAVLKTLREGAWRFGVNVAASRLTTGNHPLYERLEQELARFFGAESALVVSSGYVTNLAVAQGLAGTFSHVLLDERAHVCLVDASNFFDCPVVRFKHRDPTDLSRALARLGRFIKPILLTDGMFAHDGSVAPLRAYLRLLPRDAWLLVDDAHGAGVLGKTGGGTIELENVDRRRIVQTITLSKAFGVYGGAILCSRKVRKKIVEQSHLFAGNTPLPLPLAHAAIEATRILKRDKRLRARLSGNAAFVKESLRRAGLSLPDHPGPIIPLHPMSSELLKRRLLGADILPPFIRYPGAPRNGYFRFVISSEHTRSQLEALVKVLVVGRS
jgi:7-keto-8-aminopelargonate synthetase-like enzyme